MITVQIGNTDDKLTQKEWSAFCKATDGFIQSASCAIYFSGHSLPIALWQNACWCFDVDDAVTKAYLEKMLLRTAKAYRQDSIAWTEGETELLLTK